MTALGALYLVLWLAPLVAIAAVVHSFGRRLDAMTAHHIARADILTRRLDMQAELIATVATSQGHLLQGQIVNNHGLHILVERTTQQTVEIPGHTVH